MLRFFTPLRFVQNDTERFVQNDMGDYAWEDMRVVEADPAISLRLLAPLSPCERGVHPRRSNGWTFRPLKRRLSLE